MNNHVLSRPPLSVPMPFNKYYLDMRSKHSINSDNKDPHHVLIGVMDTGVDPGAFGLKKCPDGTNKIINVIDCTGSDDIVVKNSFDQTIDCKYRDVVRKCLNDKKLDDCKYELYFGIRSLKSYVSDRIFTTLDEKRQNIINNIVINVMVVLIADDKSNNESYESNFAIIDYDGDPNNYIVLNEYQIDQRYGSIPLEDNLYMNFGYHLYNGNTYTTNGSKQKTKICSLVFDTGGHGSHVAGIIGGNFADNTMNGIDPDCHILSLKIADSRVDGMETSLSLIRAMHELVKHNCHIVNYSFGEPIESDKGRVIDLINDYTYKYNITFVTSAGNSGPNITSACAPGSISDRTINVGAWMDKKSVTNHHFAVPNENFNQSPATWSSRGPGYNDSMGVDVMAPGSALTSHPDWYAAKLKMCRGTSMASPNVTGFLSLIMKSYYQSSGLYPHTYWLKRYLEETCEKIQSFRPINCKQDIAGNSVEAFSQGHGLIGQNIIDIDLFFLGTEYMYDFIIDNNASKKGIFNIDEKDESNNESKNEPNPESNNNYNYYQVSIRIIEREDLPGYLRLNQMVHRLRLKPDDQIKSSITLVDDDIVVHPESMSIHIGVKKNCTISGYIKVYEVFESKLRYIASIPVNQFTYTTIERNDTVMICKNQKIHPGETLRQYFIPRCSTLSFSLSGKINNKISIDLMQVYQSTRYDKRSWKKTFTKKDSLQKNQFTFNYDVVMNVLTEIVISSPFESPVVEEIKLKLCGLMKNVKLGKNLYEMNESVVVSIGKYLDDTDHTSATNIRSTMKINSIVTKYHPMKAEIFNCYEHQHWYRLDDKKLKLLRLTYTINDHANCTYLVNVGNKVYDSTVTVQGYIQGFKDNRFVFCANYIPKKVTETVDTIWVDFIDYDMDQLKKFTSTILTAYRTPLKKISIDVNLRKGVNIIDLSNSTLSTDISLNLDQVHGIDYLQTSILDEKFLIMYHKTLEPILPFESDDDPENRSLKTILTDFGYVKEFLNKIYQHQIFDPSTMDLNNNVQSDDILKVLTFASDIMSDQYNESHKKFVTMLDQSNRDAYQYIGTITTHIQQLKSINNYFNQIEHSNTRSPGFRSMKMILDLAQSIYAKKPIKDVLQKIKTIESNKNFWTNNFLSTDLDTLRERLINDSNSDQDNLIFKRKALLLRLTNEQIVW
jgi:subtilisin family serine protease